VVVGDQGASGRRRLRVQPLRAGGAAGCAAGGRLPGLGSERDGSGPAVVRRLRVAADPDGEAAVAALALVGEGRGDRRGAGSAGPGDRSQAPVPGAPGGRQPSGRPGPGRAVPALRAGHPAWPGGGGPGRCWGAPAGRRAPSGCSYAGWRWPRRCRRRHCCWPWPRCSWAGPPPCSRPPSGSASGCCRWRPARRSCATGCTTSTASSAARWPMGSLPSSWGSATPRWSWDWVSSWAGTPAWWSLARPWRSPHRSSRPAAASRTPSTGASTAAATTPPGPSRRSASACARRSTWTPLGRAAGRGRPDHATGQHVAVAAADRPRPAAGCH